MVFRFFPLLVTALVLLSTGCNHSTSVQGQVTLNDEPVKKGAISFRPVDGSGPSFGGMIADGHYSVEKATPGKKLAIISAIDVDKVAMTREESSRMIEEARAQGKNTMDAISVDLIPPHADGNNQEVEIEDGSQTLDFAIFTE